MHLQVQHCHHVFQFFLRCRALADDDGSQSLLEEQEQEQEQEQQQQQQQQQQRLTKDTNDLSAIKDFTKPTAI